MDSDDLRPIEAKARRAYELTRARDASLAFAPVIALIVGAAFLGDRAGWALLFGGFLFALGTGLLWYGRGVKRAVLPGLAAGLVPLALSLCAKHVDHLCMGAACMALCIPACFVGGVVAGVVIDLVILRGTGKLGFLAAASGVGLLTGAMGCVCSGVLGLAGLVLGFAVSALPGFVGTIVRGRASG
jgi:hypothetical protein